MESKFWDIIVVRQDGEWVGFRTPFRSLRKTATFFGLLLILAMLATCGWVLTRWKAHKLASQLSSERLRANSLELQLNDLQLKMTSSALGVPGVGEINGGAALQNFSLLPSLDQERLDSSLVEFGEISAEYDSPTQEITVKFELLRKGPKEGSLRFYWIALLHGPQGILALPSSVASRKGESLLFHRGQSVDDVKTRRAINARFHISDFVERAGSEPMYLTALLYDNKGALLLRSRQDLFMKRANQKGAGP